MGAGVNVRMTAGGARHETYMVSYRGAIESTVGNCGRASENTRRKSRAVPSMAASVRTSETESSEVVNSSSIRQAWSSVQSTALKALNEVKV